MITADAIAAHRTYSVEVRHPVEVDAGQEAHIVQWLSKRLGHQLIVPDLTVAGFRLMGGRLLPAEDGPAAQFMYENGTGERLTSAAASATRPRSAITKRAASARLLVGRRIWLCDCRQGRPRPAAAHRRACLSPDLSGWHQGQDPARAG